MECTTCYEATIPNCVESVAFAFNFPDGDYTITVTDRHSNVFVTSATATDGDLTLQATDLPPYLLSPYGGAFKVQFYAGTDCSPVELIYAYGEYTCIDMTVNNTVGGETNVTIPCE